jgi:hypothetical protein
MTLAKNIRSFVLEWTNKYEYFLMVYTYIFHFQ